jgi:hypothetical protein
MYFDQLYFRNQRSPNQKIISALKFKMKIFWHTKWRKFSEKSIFIILCVKWAVSFFYRKQFKQDAMELWLEPYLNCFFCVFF